MRGLRKTVVLTTALLALMGACGGDDAAAPDNGDAVKAPVPPQRVTATVTDKKVEFVDRLEAEPVTIELVNETKRKSFFLAFARLNDGVTTKEVAKVFPKEKVLSLVTVAGSVTSGPGSSGPVAVQFTPGTYLIGAPESKEGQVAFFEVGPATGDPVAQPVYDFNVNTGEYFIEIPEGITAGDVRFAIANNGVQSHVVAIEPKKSKDDRGLFALAPIPGGTLWTTFSLKPGKYTAICFFEDPKSGKPHFKLGMKTEFTVK